MKPSKKPLRAKLGPKWKTNKATGQRQHYFVTDGDTIFVAMTASKALWLTQALNQHHAREGSSKAETIREIARCMSKLLLLDPDAPADAPQEADAKGSARTPANWTLFRADARRLYNTLFPSARQPPKEEANKNCPTCGARVRTIFDHVAGCPQKK